MGGVALALALACASDPAGGSSAEFRAAEKAAARNRDHAYDPWPEVLGDRHRMQLVLRRCFGERSPRGLHLLVRVGAEGEPERVLVRPGGRFRACIASEVRAVRFEPPPEPGWWIELRLGR